MCTTHARQVEPTPTLSFPSQRLDCWRAFPTNWSRPTRITYLSPYCHHFTEFVSSHSMPVNIVELTSSTGSKYANPRDSIFQFEREKGKCCVYFLQTRISDGKALQFVWRWEPTRSEAMAYTLSIGSGIRFHWFVAITLALLRGVTCDLDRRYHRIIQSSHITYPNNDPPLGAKCGALCFSIMQMQATNLPVSLNGWTYFVIKKLNMKSTDICLYVFWQTSLSILIEKGVARSRLLQSV